MYAVYFIQAALSAKPALPQRVHRLRWDKLVPKERPERQNCYDQKQMSHREVSATNLELSAPLGASMSRPGDGLPRRSLNGYGVMTERY